LAGSIPARGVYGTESSITIELIQNDLRGSITSKYTCFEVPKIS